MSGSDLDRFMLACSDLKQPARSKLFPSRPGLKDIKVSLLMLLVISCVCGIARQTFALICFIFMIPRQTCFSVFSCLVVV